MLKHTTIGVCKRNEMDCEEGKGHSYEILVAKYCVAYSRHELGHLHGMYDSTAMGKPNQMPHKMRYTTRNNR